MFILIPFMQNECIYMQILNYVFHMFCILASALLECGKEYERCWNHMKSAFSFPSKMCLYFDDIMNYKDTDYRKPTQLVFVQINIVFMAPILTSRTQSRSLTLTLKRKAKKYIKLTAILF